MAGSCQSVGSFFCRASQQLPKVSIGIMVEDTPKMGTKEDEAAFIANKVAEKDGGSAAKRKLGENQALGKGKLNPWVSTRSIRHETPDPQDPALTFMQQNHSPPNATAEKAAKSRERGSETLRMKLWETLGDASQSRHVPVDQKTENNSVRESQEDRPMHEQRKPMQDTDTIETDSGNGNKPRKRSFARSTGQKTEPMRTRSKTRLPSSGPDSKEISDQKNIFTFDDCERTSLQGSKFSAQKKINTKCSRVEPKKISFSSRSTSTKSKHSSKSLQSTDKKQPTTHQPGLLSEKPFHQAGSSSVLKNDFDARKVEYSSPEMKHDGSPTFDPATSPTFALSSTPPFQKRESIEKNSSSNSKSPVTPAACSSGSDEQQQESEPGASSSNGSPLALRRSRRLPILDEPESHPPEQSSELPFCTSRSVDTASSLGILDQSAEDDNLGRAIAQLALVLDRFKAKIRSFTSKKGSEILAAARDSVHLRLLKVEELIQADTEKLASHGRSKRKRLEAAFVEQQEKLKGVYDQFREEVDRQLGGCRCRLEDMEAFEEEVKGTIDRQKSAHRKLILQVEEAMEAQLADAEATVAAIQKAARRKMNGLKGALREWLTDEGP